MDCELYKMLTNHIFIRVFVFTITLLCDFVQSKSLGFEKMQHSAPLWFMKLVSSQPLAKNIIIASRVPQFDFKHQKSLYVKT